MSNELEINSRVEFIRDLIKIAHPEIGRDGTTYIDVTGNRLSHTVCNVTNELPGEILQTGSVWTGGYLYLENLDSSVFVKIIETNTLKSFAKILPKQFTCFRAGDDFLLKYRLVANKFPCDVLIVWFEE